MTDDRTDLDQHWRWRRPLVWFVVLGSVVGALWLAVQSGVVAWLAHHPTSVWNWIASHWLAGSSIGVFISALGLWLNWAQHRHAKRLEALAGRPIWRVSSRLISNLPPRNPSFVGRADLLAQLQQELPAAGRAAIVQPQKVYGLGGVGKSQLVLEYAHRHARDYDLIWWIAAEHEAAVAGQFLALADRLKIAAIPRPSERIRLLFEELSQHGPWLVIFDNVVEIAALRAWWPLGPSGHVIITSRNPAASDDIGTHIFVDVWPRPDSISFLRLRAALDTGLASLVAESLGDLPLALEQAAAYMLETGTPATEYLDMLDRRTADILAIGGRRTVASTWTVSLRQIRQEHPVARDIMSLCAFLAPDEIPRSLLVHHEVLPEPLAAAVKDGIAFQRGLGALLRYSLMYPAGDALRVHRLVQAVTRDSLDAAEQAHWAAVALRLVLAAFPDITGDPQNWSAAADLVAHANAVTRLQVSTDGDAVACVTLTSKVAEFLWSQGAYEQSTRVALRAVTIAKTELGTSRIETARALEVFATALHDGGDAERAYPVYGQARTIYENVLGVDHPTVARTLRSIGAVSHDLGMLDRARQIYEQALPAFEIHLGADDPETAWTLSNLARVLHDEGDLSRARVLNERALAIREARLGPDHPDTAWSLHALGRVLQDEGQLDAARILHERGLAIAASSLGHDHPDTAWSLSNLGLVLAALGHRVTARQLLGQALAIYESRLGPEHPWTVKSRCNLASLN